MMERKTLLTALAMLCMSAEAFNQRDNDNHSSYYGRGGDIFSNFEERQIDRVPEIQELYYTYYYGPSVWVIIFVDILLPIACCIGIVIVIIVVIKHLRRKREREI